jgi:hypothetical protein
VQRRNPAEQVTDKALLTIRETGDYESLGRIHRLHIHAELLSHEDWMILMDQCMRRLLNFSD